MNFLKILTAEKRLRFDYHIDFSDPPDEADFELFSPPGRRGGFETRPYPLALFSELITAHYGSRLSPFARGQAN